MTNTNGVDSSDAPDLEWLSLDDDETILWAGGPDRRTMLPTVAIGIPLAIILIGIVIIVAEYLRVTNTHYVVTNRGLYRKSGILSRDVKRIDFEKVQNISYSQSALGNHFGYGTVEISTAGGSGVEMSFRSIPEPQRVQQLISDRTKRGRRDDDSERTKDDVLAEILEELRAIRTAVDGGESDEGARDVVDGGARDAVDNDGGRVVDDGSDPDAVDSEDDTRDSSEEAAVPEAEFEWETPTDE